MIKEQDNLPYKINLLVNNRSNLKKVVRGKILLVLRYCTDHRRWTTSERIFIFIPAEDTGVWIDPTLPEADQFTCAEPSHFWDYWCEADTVFTQHLPVPGNETD